MVAENEKLIYWYCNKSGLSVDDWYDLLAIELCYAVQKYDPERGAFSTYFKLRADGMVYREYRKQTSQKRYHKEVQYIDNIHDEVICYDMESLIGNDIFNDSEYGEIIKLRYDGYTQQEIARKIGVSQSYVSNLFKRLRKKYNADNR